MIKNPKGESKKRKEEEKKKEKRGKWNCRDRCTFRVGPLEGGGFRAQYAQSYPGGLVVAGPCGGT